MPTEIADLFGMLTPGKRLPTTVPLSPAEAFREDVIEFIAHIDDREGGVPGYQRASSLNKTCGRRTALAAVYPRPGGISEQITVGRRMNFDVGKALHWWWQNKYLGPMQRLWGLWFCGVCEQAVHRGLMPERCPRCKNPRVCVYDWVDQEGNPQGAQIDNITYAESLLLNSGLRFSGHPDGLLVDAGGTEPTMLNELKSISTKNYDKLKKPEAGYLDQIHGYMLSTGMRSCLITYIDKGKSCEWRGGRSGPVAGSPRFKNFFIKFDDERWAGIEAKLLDNKRAYDNPPKTPADVAGWKRVCDSPGSRLARECAYRDECFSLRVKS